MDLNILIGGKHFVLPCTISKNGSLFNIRSLQDTGANGFLFIDKRLAMRACESLGATLSPLPHSISVTGYDRKGRGVLTHYIRLHFGIDHRRQLNVPFLVLDLGGHHDVIVGRAWYELFNIKPNCRKRTLEWPANYPPTDPIVMDQDIRIRVPSDRPSKTARTSATPHQLDAERRDAALEANVRRSQPSIYSINAASSLFPNTHSLATQKNPVTLHTLASSSPPVTVTWASQLSRDIRTMENNFKDLPPSAQNPVTTKSAQITRKPRPLWTAEPLNSLPVNIYGIGGHPMHMNLKRSDNEAFYTNGYELDRLIEDRREEEEAIRRELIREPPRSQPIDALRNKQSSVLNVEINQVTDDIENVPSKYSDFYSVFSKEESNKLPPHRPHDHKIVLEPGAEKELTYSPLYKMSLTELEVVKQYLIDNLDKGFIEPSQAPFAAPVLFVKKPDGSLRFCIDYRRLNLATLKDRYPLPLIDETLAQISRAKIFTKLDIRQAFYRIRMDPASEELTTFRTRYGAYKCKVLPFGLTNGPATYQRYMNDVLFDYLDDFCTAYLDDILIFSSDPLEHELHVKKVLQRLRDAGLQADIKKSEFDVTCTKYLGFIISTKGIEVDPDKVSVVTQWQYPSNVRGVQSFLGFCNFYRRFIRNYGVIAKPLTNLTKATTPFHWTQECTEAFHALREALTSAELLRHYDPERESQIETDASDGVVAGIFSQKHGNEWHPIAYFSKTMAPAELNYEIHDKEMLAIVKALKEWRAELISTPEQIRVLTDHKALEYFMTSKALNARQARWAEFLADFHFMITYRPGKENGAADALTRRHDEASDQVAAKKELRIGQLIKDRSIDPLLLHHKSGLRVDRTGVNYIGLIEQLAPISDTTAIIDRLLQANRTTPSLEALRTQARDRPEKFTLENGLLLYQGRLVVPDTGPLRAHLIREVHDQPSTAHPGRDKTVKLLSEHYFWRGLATDVAQYVRNCHLCQKSSIPRDKTPGLLRPLDIPDAPWQHVTMDHCSFQTDKHGFNNVFVVIDRLSKQAISIPCHKKINASDMARMYVYHIYRYFGPPESIVSDRGPLFTSRFWEEFNRVLGTTLKLSAPYHPQTDGQTEIYNRYLQQRLRPFVSHYTDDWSEWLPMMDYAQLTLPHDSLRGMTPYQVIFGRLPRRAWNWDRPNPGKKDKPIVEQTRAMVDKMEEARAMATKHLEASQAGMRSRVDPHRRPVNFKEKDWVYVNMKHLTTDRPDRKLSFPREGPWKILREKNGSFELDLPLSWKITNIFTPDKLRLAPKDPLEGQQNDASEPVNVTGDDEYDVDEVLACKIVNKELCYRVKWLNRDEDWEFYPASDLKYAPHKLRDFHLANPTLPGPPRRLLEWVAAWEDEQADENYDHLADNHAMNKTSRASFFRRGG